MPRIPNLPGNQARLQNAALVEEAAAAGQLRDESKRLASAVEFFTVA
jgi:hypothetical protein